MSTLLICFCSFARSLISFFISPSSVSGMLYLESTGKSSRLIASVMALNGIAAALASVTAAAFVLHSRSNFAFASAAFFSPTLSLLTLLHPLVYQSLSLISSQAAANLLCTSLRLNPFFQRSDRDIIVGSTACFHNLFLVIF